MDNLTSGITEVEKLVKDTPGASLDIPVPQAPLTKKRIRRIAEPHLRQHKVKGYTYYAYCRGTDKEIYLGTAQMILKAVKGNNGGN